MEIEELKRHWDGMGREDPLWAVLTTPDKAGGRWDPEEFFATGRREVDSVFRQLDGLGIKPRPGRALDFGCGVGRLTQALADHFDVVHGVDIASSMIRRAEEYNRVGDRCKYHLNEKDDLSLFPDASFDLVLTLICLQHMEPRYARRYLAEFARLLSPGGVLCFQLPATMTLSTRLRRRLGAAARRLGLATWLGSRLRARPGPAQPSAYVMEMYAQPPRAVMAYLESLGLTVRSAQRDRLTGSDFVSYRYVAIRK